MAGRVPGRRHRDRRTSAGTGGTPSATDGAVPHDRAARGGRRVLRRRRRSAAAVEAAPDRVGARRSREAEADRPRAGPVHQRVAASRRGQARSVGAPGSTASTRYRSARRGTRRRTPACRPRTDPLGAPGSAAATGTATRHSPDPRHVVQAQHGPSAGDHHQVRARPCAGPRTAARRTGRRPGSRRSPTRSPPATTDAGARRRQAVRRGRPDIGAVRRGLRPTRAPSRPGSPRRPAAARAIPRRPPVAGRVVVSNEPNTAGGPRRRHRPAGAAQQRLSAPPSARGTDPAPRSARALPLTAHQAPVSRTTPACPLRPAPGGRAPAERRPARPAAPTSAADPIRSRHSSLPPPDRAGPAASTVSTGSPASSEAARSTSALSPQSRSPAGSSKICRTDQLSGAAPDQRPGRRPRRAAPMPRSAYSSQ